MANIKDTIVKFLSGYDDKESVIDRDNLEELIKTEIFCHKVFVSTIGLSKPSRFRLKQRIVELIPSVLKSNKYISFWVDYTNKLNSKAKQIEEDGFFDSVIETRILYQKALENLNKNLDKIFENEVITYENLKQSHCTALSLVMTSLIYSNWSQYMWGGLIPIFGPLQEYSMKYRENFVQTHNQEVIEITNTALQANSLDVVDLIENIRKKGEDNKLLVNGTVNKKALLGITLTTAGILAALFSGIVAINLVHKFFRWNQERLELATHKKYLKNKEMKEWLEAHTAKLKMDLESMNPNDPKYQKLVKIIETYDEKIRDLDQQINEYLDI